ncbi:MAG: sugar-binding protein [Pseudomonadota bacterium]
MRRWGTGVLLLVACVVESAPLRTPQSPALLVPQSADALSIDGQADESAWAAADWIAMNAPIIGELPAHGDFSGRYKLLWRDDALYLLAEIVDDQLSDARPDPVVEYWDDDALEVFIDSDGTAGPHRDDYRAFAYHIALDGQAVDISPDGPAVFPEHIQVQTYRQTHAPFALSWEVRIRIAVASGDGLTLSGFRPLQRGDELRFMLAYCDADDNTGRQHFVGDIAIPPRNGDRNLGYIDSRVFGHLRLVGSTQPN